MKITKRQLRKLIREAEGTTEKYDDDSALRGDQDELPDALQKGIIDKAVEDREEREEEEKNESFSITRRQLRKIIRESLLTESLQDLRNQRSDLLNNEYEQVTSDTQYPYGRNRGDVRRTTVYKRLDGQPIPDEDISLLQLHDDTEREAGGMMAALGGIHTTTVSTDGMALTVKYYKHTAG